MLVLLITLLFLLIIFNLFIWIYDSTNIKSSIEKSKKIFRIGIVVTIISYILTGLWVWLFIKK